MAGNVNFFEGLRYKGGVGMWAWILHRIAGLGVLLFVGVHVITQFLIYAGVGVESSNTYFTWYKTPGVQLFVIACLLYHALNGMRIIIIDFWPSLTVYQKEIFWLEMALWVPMVIVPALFIF